VVCAATNAYAEKQVSADDLLPNSRPWTTLRPIELLHWLGGLFYMANHTERNRKAYWERLELGNAHQLGQIMTEVRWDQIHRYLTFNPQPRTQNDPWFSRVELVASIIRHNCQNAVKASTWIAVDEAMAGYAFSESSIKAHAKRLQDMGFSAIAWLRLLLAMALTH
jgi:hypothetical protein